MTTYTQAEREALIQELRRAARLDTFFFGDKRKTLAYRAAEMLAAPSTSLERILELKSAEEKFSHVLAELAAFRAAPSTHPATTGWDNGLMQDYDKGLSRALSEKLDSREVVRNVFPAAPSTKPAEPVKRYEPERYDEDRVRMELDSDGYWVKYADFIAHHAPSTSPEMSDDLHIAYMAGYNSGKLAESKPDTWCNRHGSYSGYPNCQQCAGENQSKQLGSYIAWPPPAK